MTKINELETEVLALTERVEALEAKLANLHISFDKPVTRKRTPREYTEEERAAIRDRLVAGQLAARAKREDEAAKSAKSDG